MTASVLFQFRHEGAAAPSLSEVAQRFGFRNDELDQGYGVVKVADQYPGALYAVLADEGARARLEAGIRENANDPAVGFFANPRIEPFGPPQP